MENSLHGFMDMMFCDDENTTVNRRASGNLSLVKKMTLSNIKRGFNWAYEDILERMLCSCDSKTIRKTLEGSLKKE